jgi:hypothetical protein
MRKARVDRLERILGGVVEPFRGTMRIATFYDDEPILVPGPNEDLILLQIVRTPHRLEPPPIARDLPVDELVAEIDRLEKERDALITAKASDKGTRSHPRRPRLGVKNLAGLKGKR